jgi:polyisoprenoid-binding protein YceI
MRGKGKIIAIVGVVLLAAIGGGAWWFFRDDAPEEASIDALADAQESAETTAASTETTAAADDATTTTAAATTETTAAATEEPAATGFDGTWTVQPGEGVFAGYRIEELFGGETIKKTAVGRSPAVTGTMEISGQQVTAVSVTVDTTQITSDSDRRDGIMADTSLKTNEFPQATFELTTPFEFPAGDAVTVSVPGNLTLVGTTGPVTVDIEAQVSGETILVVGSAPIALADFAIESPTNPFVTVDDAGVMEFQLVFVRS